jgi:hypothetical protein
MAYRQAPIAVTITAKVESQSVTSIFDLVCASFVFRLLSFVSDIINSKLLVSSQELEARLVEDTSHRYRTLRYINYSINRIKSQLAPTQISPVTAWLGMSPIGEPSAMGEPQVPHKAPQPGSNRANLYCKQDVSLPVSETYPYSKQ